MSNGRKKLQTLIRIQRGFVYGIPILGSIDLEKVKEEERERLEKDARENPVLPPKCSKCGKDIYEVLREGCNKCKEIQRG